MTTSPTAGIITHHFNRNEGEMKKNISVGGNLHLRGVGKVMMDKKKTLQQAAWFIKQA